MNKVEEQFLTTIKNYNMLDAGDRIGVALSGGADSVGLFWLFYRFRKELKIRLAIVHFNHQVRAMECFRDAYFVKKLAQKMCLPFYYARKDIPQLSSQLKCSIEDIGRKERYNFFKSLLKQNLLDKIALGHTALDQTETILLNLLRGATLKGLKGILPKRNNFIRPILFIDRDKIRKYCQDNGYHFFDDTTNQDTNFVRNKIRLLLIPFLTREFNPNLINTFLRMSKVLQSEDAFWDKLTEEASERVVKSWGENEIIISREKLLKEPYALQRRLFYYLIKKLSLEGDQIITYNSLYRLESLLNLPTGKRVPLGNKIIAKRVYENIYLTRDNSVELFFQLDKELAIPGETEIKEFGLKIVSKLLDYNGESAYSKWIEYFAWDEICPPLSIRTRKKGDRFKPKGIEGSKKIKDLFIDLKIPPEDRDKSLLLVDKKEVLWIVGVRRSRVAIPTPGKQVLKIEVKSYEG